MDYEKKYKEAQKWIESIYSELSHEQQMEAEAFFPELQESKDERIRKEIIETFKNLGDGKIPVDINYADIFTWLEKQEGCEYIKKDLLEHIKQSWYKEGFIDGQYSGGTSKEWTINEAAIFYENWLKIQSATKEQRDLLFQKMKEAGYEWDAEKKELKKLSNTLEECEHIEHGKYYYCIKDYYSGGHKRASKGEVVQALRGMSMMALGVEANEYFIPVKCIVDDRHAWSEEDEEAIGMAIIALEDMYDEDAPNTTYGGYNLPFNKAAERLKSLKDRVQPKQEWKQDY